MEEVDVSAGDSAFFLVGWSPVQPWFGVSFGRSF